MNPKTPIYSVRTFYINEPKSDPKIVQWASQIGLTKRLNDPPNEFGDSLAHWLLLGWLAVTFGGLEFKGRCVECPLCSMNGQPFYASHWISRRSWNLAKGVQRVAKVAGISP